VTSVTWRPCVALGPTCWKSIDVDAQRWHEICSEESPEEPPRLTAAQWRTLPEAERNTHIDQLDRWLNRIYLETDKLTAIAAAMTNTVKTNTRRPPGAREIIGLTGPNLIGKSTFMMRWGRTQYREWTRGAHIDKRGRPVFFPAPGYEADLCPVGWINLPAGASSSDVDRKILEHFGLAEEGRVRGFTNQAIGAARRHRVQALIIDDVHLLKTDCRTGRVALDHLKHLNTELGYIDATLVLVGANLGGGDLVNDPQIAGRLKIHTCVPHAVDNEDEMRRWQGIVYQLERRILPHLPAGKPGMLYTKLAGELWYRTYGYLGDLKQVVCEATLAATRDGTHRIMAEHLDGVELTERVKREHIAEKAAQRRSKTRPPR
jgi:hypothetical protein